jgi:hypothetical protein
MQHPPTSPRRLPRPLPQVDNGTVAWGDYDNDGRLDFLLTGRDTTGTNAFSQIWHNNSDGTFSNVTASVVTGLPELEASRAGWGDFDNDGRLDFLLAGFDPNSGTKYTQIWRNIAPGTNAPPAAPTGLATTGTANAVTLSWSSAGDDHTAANGLTYNVRAGTTPGGTDLLATNVDAGTGFRRVMIASIGGTNYLTCTLPVPKDYAFGYFGSAALFFQAPYRGVRALDEMFVSDDLASGFPNGGIQCIEVTPALDGPVAGQPDLPALPDTHTYRTVQLSVGTDSLPQGFLLWGTLPISPP